MLFLTSFSFSVSPNFASLVFPLVQLAPRICTCTAQSPHVLHTSEAPPKTQIFLTMPPDTQLLELELLELLFILASPRVSMPRAVAVSLTQRFSLSLLCALLF